MTSVKDNNDEITNSTFISENDKESSTLPHCPALDSEVANVIINNSTSKEESKYSDTSRGWKMLILHRFPLVTTMVIVAVILQIPSVLYYTDPPSAEANLLDQVDLETCSVSLTCS